MNTSMNKLLIILTPSVQTKDLKISKDIHSIRRKILITKRDKIVQLLQMNYLNIITECIRGLTPQSDPLKLLLKLRKKDTTSVNNRSNDLVYNYMVILHSILYALTIIDQNTECSIEYEDINYES